MRSNFSNAKIGLSYYDKLCDKITEMQTIRTKETMLYGAVKIDDRHVPCVVQIRNFATIDHSLLC